MIEYKFYVLNFRKIFIITIITTPIPAALRLLDPYTSLSLFPDNNTDLIWWILILHTGAEDMLRAMGFTLVISMIHDIVDMGSSNTTIFGRCGYA